MRIDGDILDQLNNYIIRIVDDRIQKKLNIMRNSTETYRHVRVIDTKNETNSTGEVMSTLSATVQDMVTKEIIENVPNKSGDKLSVGDIVRIYETKGHFHKQYIGLNCGME